MKNRFDLIIFDWDGTLIDSIDWIARCLQNAANNTRHTTPNYQSAKDVIGLSIDKAIAALFPDANENEVHTLVDHYEKAYFSKKISRDDLFTGVFDMLEALKTSGYLLAIATGKTREGADETQSKPHPKMLEEIMTHLQISPERVLMVGDSTHDLQMAINAGIASVGVASGSHDADQLLQYQPLHCLSNPVELRLHFID
jgi:phosphoglycolate phosphatase